MRKIVDLSLPIQPHWRYGIQFGHPKTHKNGDPWQTTSYNLESHWFTHIDAPLHHTEKGDPLGAFPIEDWCMGKALVMDFTNVEDNQGITAEMLEKANEPYKDQHFDYLLIRTDRAKKADWTTTEFWDNSPYITDDGGVWLRDYGPKVIGYDFPQDYDIRKIRTTKNLNEIVQPVHDHVLAEGRILQVEYMTNLWSIGSDTCEVVCLPLPLGLEEFDGTQVRIIAIVNE